MAMSLQTSTLSQHLLSFRGETRRKIQLVELERTDTSLTYDELLRRSLRCLQGLQARGMQPGDELVLQFPTNEWFLPAFWGAMLGGIIPVPLAPAATPETFKKLVSVVTRLSNPRVATTTQALERLRTVSAESVDLSVFGDRILLMDQALGDETEARIHNALPEDIAFLQFSSGSTGRPKGVVLTHDNLLANVRAILRGLETREDDVSLSWMPLNHDMGLIGFHIAPLLLGVDHCLMSPQLFVREPWMWMHKASQLGATVTASPNFGYRLFLKRWDPSQAKDWDLSRMRVILNGAEPISADLAETFLQTLAPHGLSPRVMFPVYGLAEASLAVTFPTVGSGLHAVGFQRNLLSPGDGAQTLPVDHVDAVKLVDLGQPVQDCQIRVVDGSGNPLPEDHVGRVQVRGRNVTKGYYLDSEETHRTISVDGWLNTGDLGLMHQGSFFCAGREKEIIFIHGQNFHPHDIESQLEHVVALRPGSYAVVGAFCTEQMRDELVVFVEWKQDVEGMVPLSRAIRRALGTAMRIDVETVVPIDKIPRTTSGKVQRTLLAKRYKSNEFASVLREISALVPLEPLPDADGTLATLLRIWKSVCESQDIRPDDNFQELGISSLKLAQLQGELDKVWPGRIMLADLFTHASINHLARFIDGGFKRTGRPGLITYTEVPPRAFSTQSHREVDTAGFCFELASTQHERLVALATADGARVDDLVLAVAVAAWSQCTQRPRVALQSMQERPGSVKVMLFNVTTDTNLGQLVGSAFTQHSSAITPVMDLEDIARMSCHAPVGMVSLLVSRKDLQRETFNLARLYDVVLTYDSNARGVKFTCEHSSGLLAPTSISEFASTMASMLNALTLQDTAPSTPAKKTLVEA